MSAEIHHLPNRPDREWRHIAEALRSGIMQRTGSTEIADAVAARCKVVYDLTIPQPLPFSERPPEDVMDFLHVVVGGFMGQVGLLVEEIELMKANGGAVA